VAQGGHAVYAGNEVDVLDLERDQPLWSQILPPTPNSQVTNCQPYYADGRPTSRQSYYGVTFNEFDDLFMLFGGVWYCDIGGFFGAISSYNIAANSYNGAGTHPDLVDPFKTLPAIALNPLTGDVYFANIGQLGRWNRSSNTFTANLNPSGSGALGDYTMAAFDTSRGRILFLGGQNLDHHLYTLSSNSWSTITATGANASNVTGMQQASLVYVPAMDVYVVRDSSAGGTVYQINPGTFEVTTFATAGGASIPSIVTGSFNKFLYVPRLRGAAYVPSYNGNAWFLRLHP
jgi:hypothetical protein